MRLSSVVALLSCVGSIRSAAIAGRDEPDAQVDDLLVQAQQITKQTLEGDNAKRTLGGSCTLNNLSIRREW